MKEIEAKKMRVYNNNSPAEKRQGRISTMKTAVKPFAQRSQEATYDERRMFTHIRVMEPRWVIYLRCATEETADLDHLNPCWVGGYSFSRLLGGGFGGGGLLCRHYILRVLLRVCRRWSSRCGGRNGEECRNS